MQKVTKFAAFDGKTFDSASACQTYEKEEGTIRRLVNILETSVKTGRVDAVIRHIAQESENVQAVLSSLNQHKRRCKKAVPN